MTASGETHHADALRIDLPFRGIATDLKHRLDGILKLRGITIACAAEPVTQHEDSEALLIQPQREWLRLPLVNATVAAARDQQHR